MKDPICGRHCVSLSVETCEAEHNRQSLLAKGLAASWSDKRRHREQLSVLKKKAAPSLCHLHYQAGC